MKATREGGPGGRGRRLLSPPNIPSIRRSARRWGRAHRWGGSSRQPWRATCAKTRTGAVAAGRSGGSRCSCVLRESGRNFWKGAGLGRAAGIACGVLRDVMQCGKRVLQWPTTAGVPRRMGVLNVGRLTLAPEQHQKDARGFSLSLRLVPLAAGKILQKPKIVARGPAAYGTHEQMASRNRDARRCWRRDLLRVDSELVFHCSARGRSRQAPMGQEHGLPNKPWNLGRHALVGAGAGQCAGHKPAAPAAAGLLHAGWG